MAEKTKKNWQKVKDLMEYHRETFKMLGLEYKTVSYIPKMFYTPSGKDEMFVSFFLSEMRMGVDIYTEMVNRDYESEDPQRILYKWVHNPQWAEDYEKTDVAPVRYLVPARILEQVTDLDPGNQARSHNEEDMKKYPLRPEDCEDGDCGLEEMSMRDLYAIIQNIDCSNKEWLNVLIRNNKTGNVPTKI